MMVSVIIPTFNREHTLSKSINSILSQSYTDLELIIADDCSTDNTKALVNGIKDSRVKYICLEKNQGACAARNAGINIAKGDIIAFHDSDDEWMPGKLEKVLEILNETDADVCFHKLRRHYPNENRESFFPDIDTSRFFSHEELCNLAIISTQTIVAKRAVFDEHKFDPQVRKSQDYDWAIRASRNYSFYFLNEVLADQYFQTDSISAKGLTVIKETRQYFLEKYKDEFEMNPKFELYQLLVIARMKSLLGESAKEEYRRIFQLRRSKEDLLKMILSEIGLLTLLYRIKRKPDGSLPVGTKLCKKDAAAKEE